MEGGHCRCHWTEKEDDLLRIAVGIHGSSKWSLIKQLVGTKSGRQCKQRWNSVLKPDLVKGRWTPEEDEILVTLILEGSRNWHEISKHIPGRTGKQCKARWTQQLDPSISKKDFTKEDDEFLIRTVNEVGKRWVQIAKMLPGRTESAVRQRWMQLTKTPGRLIDLGDNNFDIKTTSPMISTKALSKNSADEKEEQFLRSDNCHPLKNMNSLQSQYQDGKECKLIDLRSACEYLVNVYKLISQQDTNCDE